MLHLLRQRGGEEFVALLHAAFLYWLHGEPVRRLEPARWPGVMETAGSAPAPARAVEYVQFPALRIWGAGGEGATHEPFDGCFLVQRGERLAVVGILGAHPGREGLTVVAVEGERPVALARPGGSPLFSPVMEGGLEAGLHSVTGMEELLELGWRLVSLGGKA